MIVEMAAIVGSIKSLRALNMCLVKVALTPPEMKIEMMTEAGSGSQTEKTLFWPKLIMKRAFDSKEPVLFHGGHVSEFSLWRFWEVPGRPRFLEFYNAPCVLGRTG